MYDVHCIHRTMFTVQCPLYSVHYTLYNVCSIVYSVRSTIYTVQCSLYTVQCTPSTFADVNNRDIPGLIMITSRRRCYVQLRNVQYYNDSTYIHIVIVT